nr:dihydropyrimidinase [Chloroflexota bacterium]
IFDPERTRRVQASEMHSACDYDPYEGWEVTGWPAVTLLRGEVVYAKGEILARPGAGRLVARAASHGTPS